ncbi:NAD kinase [Bacillus suaedaesalsae]|uniref:NAD kinase n=1 Tax=Bacillus suaedaesalsae TaxID=2810349 RepID=A0ABS2DG41_9BACI|nr:NAD kinase [Bacillus suaedaesalsae]MBM6617451.1 NAD kinase [Bacillus suaedaesalsae]
MALNRRNIYLFYKREPELLPHVEQLKELALSHNFSIVKSHTEANIIVSIGDDGTFLQAVRQSGFRDDCLYVGLTTHSTLSLYCDFRIEEKEQMIFAMTEKQVEVRRYPIIEVSVDDSTFFYCLNELSIRSSIIKTFVMDVWIDDLHFETFRGDGMIVATPTGSTGYNKSVNGSIVDPMLPCLQVSELASVNNNKYRTLGSPFILSEARTLTLKVIQDGNDYPIIGLDNEALSIQHVEQLVVKLSNKRIKTVKLKDNSFWEKVKRTFL